MRRGGANIEQRGESEYRNREHRWTRIVEKVEEMEKSGEGKYRGNTDKQKKKRNEERRAKKNRGIVKYKEQESRIG